MSSDTAKNELKRKKLNEGRMTCGLNPVSIDDFELANKLLADKFLSEGDYQDALENASIDNLRAFLGRTLSSKNVLLDLKATNVRREGAGLPAITLVEYEGLQDGLVNGSLTQNTYREQMGFSPARNVFEHTPDLVDELITGRRAVYGDPEETFKEHAAMWTVVLGRKLKPGVSISAEDVSALMIAYKLMRAVQTPDYSDNIHDVVGYADIFEKVQGDKFVHARSVDEYIMKKHNKRVEEENDPSS